MGWLHDLTCTCSVQRGRGGMQITTDFSLDQTSKVMEKKADFEFFYMTYFHTKYMFFFCICIVLYKTNTVTHIIRVFVDE